MSTLTNVQLITTFAEKVTEGSDTGGKTKQDLENLVAQCIDMRTVENDQTALFCGFSTLPADTVGVVATITSCSFRCCKMDLILSVHGIQKGDFILMNGLRLDFLGDRPDCIFTQPWNAAATPYTCAEVVCLNHPATDISIRGVWILNDSVRAEISSHSTKKIRITYDPLEKYEFCLYRGCHLDWSIRDCFH